ncbi:hypothetical protein [Haloferula sargassicola]|uniref:Uncharacterized protein n=1 Tax=Haloferula sargassicola TaxID=490096 RepID=A0ABP9UNV9_9BACT
MKTIDEAFAEQQLALDRAVAASLALQQFRSLHTAGEWTPEIGGALQPLLRELTTAAESLGYKSRVALLYNERKLGLR